MFSPGFKNFCAAKHSEITDILVKLLVLKEFFSVRIPSGIALCMAHSEGQQGFTIHTTFTILGYSTIILKKLYLFNFFSNNEENNNISINRI